ncbi:MAG: hypothetical protein ACI8TQ_002152 [Planctomycetota bacterium]|jgi:uncharacterized protein involved in cysteine biosynthesis
MSSRITPCSLCGYHAPAGNCPHCALDPIESSLAKPITGLLAGTWAGMTAVPHGIGLLIKTRQIKRWLIPPLFLTLMSLIVLLYFLFGWLEVWFEGAIPGDIELGPPSWEWLTNLTESYEWAASTIAGLTSAASWVANSAMGLMANRISGVILYSFFCILASWYVFSIAYEAFAGPFLDVIQGKLEAKWFGKDPRDTIERPTDLPTDRVMRLSMYALVPSTCLIVLAFVTPLPVWLALLSLPIAFALAIKVDPRYGTWLRWIAKIEAGAITVSIKASLITLLILLFTWPLYFVFPPIGYVMFAIICGFATSLSLLDIPFERRGWSIRQRLRFVRRNIIPLTAFGIVTGLLLAVPVLGPLIMVPSASIGGMRLLCRLDKTGL